MSYMMGYDSMYDAEPEDEPPPCDDCGGDYGEHADWCPNAPPPPTRRERFLNWWNGIYYRRYLTPSIYNVHMRLKRLLPKRKVVPIYDDDIPF